MNLDKIKNLADANENYRVKYLNTTLRGIEININDNYVAKQKVTYCEIINLTYDIINLKKKRVEIVGNKDKEKDWKLYCSLIDTKKLELIQLITNL